jgi:hypothetical protein
MVKHRLPQDHKHTCSQLAGSSMGIPFLVRLGGHADCHIRRSLVTIDTSSDSFHCAKNYLRCAGPWLRHASCCIT